VLPARRLTGGSPCWITVDQAKEEELRERIAHSTRIQRQRKTQHP
jgi:hypothetical protein